jgi:hypothetical protein
LGEILVPLFGSASFDTHSGGGSIKLQFFLCVQGFKQLHVVFVGQRKVADFSRGHSPTRPQLVRHLRFHWFIVIDGIVIKRPCLNGLSFAGGDVRCHERLSCERVQACFFMGRHAVLPGHSFLNGWSKCGHHATVAKRPVVLHFAEQPLAGRNGTSNSRLHDAKGDEVGGCAVLRGVWLRCNDVDAHVFQLP